jgi:CspA family cold shock protein
MASGKVKWFNDKKGYGFIIPDEGGSDIFVHHTGIVCEGFRTLKENEQVEYNVTEGKKGPMAIDVKKIA